MGHFLLLYIFIISLIPSLCRDSSFASTVITPNHCGDGTASFAVTAVTKQRGLMAFFRRDSKRSLPTPPKKQQANARVCPRVASFETLKVSRQAKSVFEVASTQISNASVLTQRVCHSGGAFQALLAGQWTQLKPSIIFFREQIKLV